MNYDITAWEVMSRQASQARKFAALASKMRRVQDEALLPLVRAMSCDRVSMATWPDGTTELRLDEKPLVRMVFAPTVEEE